MRPLNCRVFNEFYCPVTAGYRDGSGVLPYDKAVVRALESRHKYPKDITSCPDKTLFVGRLCENIEEDKLIKVFSRFGEVKQAHIVRDIVTGSSRGYGFVTFSSTVEAENAWADGHIFNLLGADIIIEKEFGRKMRNWIPRRLGGGLGGRKESGQLRFGGCARPFVSTPEVLKRRSLASNSSSSPPRVLVHLSADEHFGNSRNWKTPIRPLKRETEHNEEYRRRFRDGANRNCRDRTRNPDDMEKQEHYYEYPRYKKEGQPVRDKMTVRYKVKFQYHGYDDASGSDEDDKRGDVRGSKVKDDFNDSTTYSSSSRHKNTNRGERLRKSSSRAEPGRTYDYRSDFSDLSPSCSHKKNKSSPRKSSHKKKKRSK